MAPWSPWLLLSLALGLASALDCPLNCQCEAHEVTCSDQNLSQYPVGIPLGTRRLRLDGNQLVFLPALSLGLLSDLVDLDCSRNQLREVLDYTFLGVFRLLFLDLSANRLLHIAPHGFSTLSSLLHLNLSHNPRLRSLHQLTFANTTALRYLDLRHTGLSTLDHAMVDYLPALDTLYLSGNPWHCDCSLMDFAIHLLVSHLRHPGEGTDAPSRSLGWAVTGAGQGRGHMLTAECEGAGPGQLQRVPLTPSPCGP